ncbi:hypothetical protein C2845_PM01G43330 [Panicum miliaceum]|uniref:Uncharacterized protein n=1 Tax=Panicum miliaceum TaxID=4540 RepID=A0A3L6TSN7_PANMI|nr:hypothetical protein C2845_PM01G43330 [Panicum miliaceum]
MPVRTSSAGAQLREPAHWEGQWQNDANEGVLAEEWEDLLMEGHVEEFVEGSGDDPGAGSRMTDADVLANRGCGPSWLRSLETTTVRLGTSAATTVYRDAVSTGLVPSSDVLSQVLGCLRLPHDSSLKSSFIENMGISCDIPHNPNINSLFEGFGEYDIRAFSILEEAASLGAVASISMKDTRIVIDARKLRIHTAEVSLLTTLRSLKHQLAAGARLPNVTILLPTEKKQVDIDEREKTLKLAGRIGQAVGSLLRRLGISYQGEESHGRMRINGLTLRRWFNPKLNSKSSSAAPADLLPLSSRLAKGIADQQRDIRSLSF